MQESEDVELKELIKVEKVDGKIEVIVPEQESIPRSIPGNKLKC